MGSYHMRTCPDEPSIILQLVLAALPLLLKHWLRIRFGIRLRIGLAKGLKGRF